MVALFATVGRVELKLSPWPGEEYVTSRTEHNKKSVQMIRGRDIGIDSACLRLDLLIDRVICLV
jgi:hypothetical protein